MLTGNATEPSRTSFRGPSPRLVAAQPSNQASGEFLLDLALQRISANEIESEAAHTVFRVYGINSARRVVDGFRDANPKQLNLW